MLISLKSRWPTLPTHKKRITKLEKKMELFLGHLLRIQVVWSFQYKIGLLTTFNDLVYCKFRRLELRGYSFPTSWCVLGHLQCYLETRSKLCIKYLEISYLILVNEVFCVETWMAPSRAHREHLKFLCKNICLVDFLEIDLLPTIGLPNNIKPEQTLNGEMHQPRSWKSCV